MTVSTELSHEEYTGNGVTTDFDFRFRIFEAKHLVVSVADPDGTERILTNGTDYTLRGVGSYRGGKVILKMPLATGWKIGIARDLPAVQETDLRNQGKFFAEVHEDAFDYLTMLIQKSLGYLSLCLRKPSFISDHYDAKGNKISNLGKPVKDGDAVDLGTMKELISAKNKRSLRVADKDIPVLPNTANRANKMLAFDNDGNPKVVLPESGSAADVLLELAKPTGAGLVGTESGKTVQESLDNVSEVVEGNTINSNEYKVLNNDLFSPFGHMGVLVTGQSLAEGGVGNNVFPPVMSCMNYCAKTLSLGPVMYSDNTIGSDIIGVKEPIRASVSTTLTDGLITRCIADNAYISGQAWGGKKYVDIKKNGNTDLYNKCLAQVTRFKALRPSINYGAVVVIHGEADGYVNNTNYADNIIEWQKDFNADISFITGQKNKIPMFLCQTATAGGYGWNGGINDMNFQSPIQQLIAHESKGDVFMVCSKYHLKYADHAHITNESQAVLGEYYAKAMDSYYSTGSWEPCRPVSIIQSGTSITIKFTGVEDGLVFDESAVKPVENKGFAFSDDSGAEIIDVAISGKDSVVISLSKTPTTSKVLAYAYHNGAGGSANQVNGLGDRGNLRGTSKQTSKTTGLNLHNWCVIFRKEF